jgi:hypothetical protein
MADEITPGDEPSTENPKYDQAFFLKLAAKGKDVWNAWRRDSANKDVRVTFHCADFFFDPWDQIDFSGFEFGDFADFSGCTWRGEGDWRPTGLFSPGRACFTGAVFGDCANFAGALFGYKSAYAQRLKILQFMAGFGGLAGFHRVESSNGI